MTRDELKTTVLTTLRSIAPEMEPAEVKADVPLRIQLDIDSMDALNFFIRLHEKLGVDIPEADYRKLNTLNECVTYLAARLAIRNDGRL
ncbi:MAG TPA: acyl carrier protein [bacterium]|nr:acyl carrier protein [bacterium]